MEINKTNGVITGVIPTADVPEGRLGLFSAHTWSYDFGSRTDLPGWHVPATAAEAKFARFAITFAVDNTPFPQVKPYPSYGWALRGGFDQATQTPTSVTLYLTDPAKQKQKTIPSGQPSLAFGKGVYTFYTGDYIASASWAVGAGVVVANTADDGGATHAGKLKVSTTFDADTVVGLVREYNSTTGDLTVELL
jgi:hypothetical protein